MEQQFEKALSRRVLWASLSMAVILGFARLSYGLLLPVIQTDLSGSYFLLGLVNTLNFVGYLVGTIILPLALKLFPDRQRFYTLAMVALALTLVGSATSFSLEILAVWRFLAGLFSAVATVLIMSLTLEPIAAKERGLASGLIWLGGSFGIVLSGLVAPVVLSFGTGVGWRITWVLMAVAAFYITLNFRKIAVAQAVTPSLTLPTKDNWADVKAGESIAKPFSLRMLLEPSKLLFLALCYFLFGAGYIIYFTFFIALVKEQGVAVQWVGLIWAVIGSGGMVGGWLWGKAVDRWPNGLTLAISLAAGTIGLLTVLTPYFGLELIGAFLFGACASISPALIVTALLRKAVNGQAYATLLSYLTAIFALGQIIGPLVASIIIDRLGLMAGVISSAPILLVAALCAVGYNNAQHLHQNEQPQQQPAIHISGQQLP